MNLHGKIMNLPATTAWEETALSRAYKEGHRDARHAAAELALRADAALDAAREVLKFRHDTPTTGYLHDNDASRAALRKLATAVESAVGAA